MCISLLGWCVVLGAAGPARAQPVLSGLRPVDAGREDVSPLARSLRMMQPDLRSPSGFERVYEVRAPRGLYGEAQDGLYARISGGVVAVFSASRYAALGAGARAEIPAGTVFLLGDPAATIARLRESLPPEVRPGNASAPAGGPARGGFVDRRVNARAPAAADAPLGGLPAPVAPMAERSIWSDESYRRERVAARLGELE